MSETGWREETAALLKEAEATCERRGAKLTPLRRQVLGLVLESATPAGAYDLLDQLRRDHAGAAPPTIYRALDFLLEQGLIHKVERISAFVGCVHGVAEAAGGEGHHAVQFLICQSCHQVTEVDDPAIREALARAAARAGFRLGRSTVEAEGLCAACLSEAPAAAGTGMA